MLIIPPSPYRKRRRPAKHQPSPAPPPVSAPVLVAAAWDVASNVVTLTFDRAVDPSGMGPEVVTIFDGVQGFEYHSNNDVSQPNANTVQVVALEFGEFEGTGRHLTAAAPTGIVAVDGGVAWAGVVDLELPFP